jgi:hypothetical protein
VTEAPDLSTYHLIHRAIRHSADQLAAAVADLDDGDRRQARAVAWWYDRFTKELHDHHTVEDEIFFPALAARIPTFAAHDAALAADHEHLDEVVAALAAALSGLAGDGDWASCRQVALDQAVELACFLHEHLGTEDDDVLPLFERHFSAAEYERLDEAARTAHSPVGMLFTIPWVLSVCTDGERDGLLASAPKMIEILYRLGRSRYARRTAAAFGATAPVVAR